MFKKIIIGILSASVVGAGGAAIAYNAASQESQAPPAISPIISQDSEPIQEQTNPIAAVADSQEEPWQASGLIAGLEDAGLYLALQEGDIHYVELGPSDYWQNQDVQLEIGQQATITGTINEDMIHAAKVVLADGQTLNLRTESGQPLWSGGIDNSQDQNAAQQDGDQTPDPQVQVDEWITITGTLMSFQGGRMTMATPEGELITFQSGQPRFFAEQGVTFQVGDEIRVVGFYEEEQFKAGDITQLATGLRVMLLDPNGRPLWAGPGNSNGNGNGGQNK